VKARAAFPLSLFSFQSTDALFPLLRRAFLLSSLSIVCYAFPRGTFICARRSELHASSVLLSAAPVMLASCRVPFSLSLSHARSKERERGSKERKHEEKERPLLFFLFFLKCEFFSTL
jgi:hypothetical protein